MSVILSEFRGRFFCAGSKECGSDGMEMIYNPGSVKCRRENEIDREKSEQAGGKREGEEGCQENKRRNWRICFECEDKSEL